MGEPVIDWKLPTDQGRRDLERVRGRLERAGIPPGERGYDEQALNDATVRLGYRCKYGTEGGAWLATVSGSFPGSGGPFQQTCWGWSLEVAWARALDWALRSRPPDPSHPPPFP